MTNIAPEKPTTTQSPAISTVTASACATIPRSLDLSSIVGILYALFAGGGASRGVVTQHPAVHVPLRPVEPPDCADNTELGLPVPAGPTGNRTNATELTGRTLNWSYDDIYRLTSEAVSQDPAGKNGAVGYALDPVGNRLSANSTLSGVSSGSYSYNINDLLSIETYDANGNTLVTGGKTFTYDSENRLRSMNGGAVTLLYDGDGNRVAKTVGGVTTRYLVDDLNPTGYPQVVEEAVGGVVTREYTYGLQLINENQVVNNVWTSSFYGYDGFGSVRQLTNASGAITDKYDYDAFGNLLNKTGSTPNSYLYRGEQFDSDLGLYYLRARYYNPATGRFLSRDPDDGKPLDPKTLHKYLYADGDPINGIDPQGRAVLIEFSLGRRTFQVAFHGAHHWEVVVVGRLWCIHLQFLTYVAGLSGSGAKFQIPLPWCSAGGPF